MTDDRHPQDAIMEDEVDQKIYLHPERGEMCNYCLAAEGIHHVWLENACQEAPEDTECPCGFIQ